jgi:hypothetical protein
MEPFWCWGKPRVNSDSLWTHTHSGLGSKPSPHSFGGEASIFPPWGSQPLPPYSILCDSPRNPHPNGYFSRDSCAGVPESRQMGLSGPLSPITLRADLPSWRNLKQSCSSRRDLSNAVSHSRIEHREEVDSWLLMVGSQTGNSTPGPSFGHNLCYRCLNEQCELILDIYASRPFHWYKECHNLLSFDPCNCSLKFRESLWDSNSHQLPTWEFTWDPHTLWTLSTPGSMWCDSRVYYLACNLATPCLDRKPRLGLRQSPTYIWEMDYYGTSKIDSMCRKGKLGTHFWRNVMMDRLRAMVVQSTPQHS